MTKDAGAMELRQQSALRASSFRFPSDFVIRISSFVWQIRLDTRRPENVDERDLEKEHPAQPHQLIVAKTGQSEADPDKYKKEGRNFSEENENVNKTKKPPAVTVGDTGEMPASEKKGNDNGRPGDHGTISPEKKAGDLHGAVFG